MSRKENETKIQAHKTYPTPFLEKLPFTLPRDGDGLSSNLELSGGRISVDPSLPRLNFCSYLLCDNTGLSHCCKP